MKRTTVGYLSEETIRYLIDDAKAQIPALNGDEEYDAEDLAEIAGDLEALLWDRKAKISVMTRDWMFAEIDWLCGLAIEGLRNEKKEAVKG